MILVVTNGASRLQGGMFDSVRHLWRATAERGYMAEVMAVADEFSEKDAPAYAPNQVSTFPSVGPRRLYWSPALHRNLQEAAREVDLISCHGMWSYPAWAAWSAARRSRVPLILHPEGMLEPYALAISSGRKQVARWLFQDKALREAACLRAISWGEARNFRVYGYKGPIALIANGLHAEGFAGLPPREALGERFPVLKGRKVLLFLSRVHPKKGLVPLLDAWKRLKRVRESGNWILMIAGPDENNHEAELRKIVADARMNADVLFAGPLYGEEKKMAYAGADAFVLPSYSETLGLVVMEAAVCGLPVVLTKECNFSEVVKAGGALEARPEAKSLARALETLLGMGDVERRLMGGRGEHLIRSRYTWTRAGQRMAEVCQWLAGGGPPPPWVDVDGSKYSR
jgi:poly(glycerol-phosphate) alpha-glucosyltransferase